MTLTPGGPASLITVTGNYSKVKVTSRNGADTDEVYYTINDVVPTVGGNDCYVLPACIASEIVEEETTSGDTIPVRLISDAATKVSVQGIR
jgi:hypothetical protein